MTIRIDIDGTLIESEKVFCRHCGRTIYKNPEPIKAEIKLLNKAYKKNIIILCTGRGEDTRSATEKMLSDFGIKYHWLEMGKGFDIYIDSENAHKSLSEVKL